MPPNLIIHNEMSYIYSDIILATDTATVTEQRLYSLEMTTLSQIIWLSSAGEILNVIDITMSIFPYPG